MKDEARPTEVIVAIDNSESVNNKQYKGKQSVLIGAISLISLLAIGIFLTSYFGVQLYNETDRDSAEGLNDANVDDTPIGGGDPIDSLISNPAVWPNRNCRQPNWIVKNNLIVAEYSDKDIAVPIKGISWYGMESKNGVPLGLWVNARGGSSIYSIGKFLKDNNFNSVRIPIAIENLFRNIKPNEDLVNEAKNRALNLNNYIELLKTIVQGLEVHGISVLIDFHNLTPDDPGELWFNNAVQDAEYEKAIDLLAEEMCNSRHWNVIGIELKNAPDAATWGDNTTTDWKKAVEKYGNRILSKCSNWLIFVDGVSKKRKETINDKDVVYTDFEGGGLQDVGNQYPKLSKQNKYVWSPHYYSPSKVPQPFFYKNDDPTADNYEELDDENLKNAVKDSMNNMFGYLTENNDNQAIVLSEYGGLFDDLDAHKELTSHRVIENIVEMIKGSDLNLAGGYAWALNPRTAWFNNPVNNIVFQVSGLLDNEWRNANKAMLEVLSELDDIPGLDQLQCRK